MDEPEPVTTLDVHRTLTIVGLLALAIGALFFDLDVGFSAFVVAIFLSLADPHGTKGAINQIAWPTVLLVCGIVTYVSLMENIGTIDWLGEEVATIGTVLVAALLICYIGGVVSAFASTTGILGALIPLAVPFLTDGREHRCHRPDHRSGHLIVGRRLEPVLDERIPGRGQLAGGSARLCVPSAHPLGVLDGR